MIPGITAGGGTIVGDLDPYFSNVVLLAFMQGADGSTTFPDSSLSPKSIVALGGAEISTDQSLWGDSSGLFNGSGARLTIAAGTADLNFGSGDFTVEAWVRPTSLSGNKYLAIGQGDLATVEGSSWAMTLNGANSDLYVGSSVYSAAPPVPPVGEWSHVAWAREGSTFRTFLNGVIVGSVGSVSGAINNGATTYPNAIAALPTGSSSFDGHIDSVRITKGVARYTANFTPPSGPFPAS